MRTQPLEYQFPAPLQRKGQERALVGTQESQSVLLVAAEGPPPGSGAHPPLVEVSLRSGFLFLRSIRPSPRHPYLITRYHAPLRVSRAATCVPSPLVPRSNPGHQHEPFSQVPPSLQPRRLSRLPFTYPASQTPFTQAAPYLSAAPSTQCTWDPSPIPPQSCSYRRPEPPPSHQSQWPLSVPSHVNSQWPAATLTTSSFAKRSPVLASQTPHSAFSSELPFWAPILAPGHPHDQTSPPQLPPAEAPAPTTRQGRPSPNLSPGAPHLGLLSNLFT